MTDDLDVPIAKFAHKRVGVLRHGGLGVAIGWGRRLTSSAQVRGYDGVSGGEFRDQRPPHVARLSITMQQYYGIAFPGDQIMYPHSVDLREAAFHRLRGLERSRCFTRGHKGSLRQELTKAANRVCDASTGRAVKPTPDSS